MKKIVVIPDLHSGSMTNKQIAELAENLSKATMKKKMSLYNHDCSHCEFLGAEEVNGKHVDVYYCKANLTGPTLIIRYSSEGSDYTTFPQFLAVKPSSFADCEETKIAIKYYKQLGIL